MVVCRITCAFLALWQCTETFNSPWQDNCGARYLDKEDCCLLLRVVLARHLFQSVQQVPSSQPFHENDHLLLVLDHLIAGHNVGVIQYLQKLCFPASTPNLHITHK